MFSKARKHSQEKIQEKEEPIPQILKEELLPWPEIEDSLQDLLLQINRDANGFPKKYVYLWLEVTDRVRRNVFANDQKQSYLAIIAFRHLISQLEYQGWREALSKIGKWTTKTRIWKMEPLLTQQQHNEQMMIIDQKLQEIS
jgi:hypothetical protein